MILHTLASRRANYIHRRGIRAMQLRQYRVALKNKVEVFEQIREQAVAAGAVTDVTNIEAVLIETRQALHDAR